MCRDDNVDQLLTLFEKVAPNLPSCARTASIDLVRHKANFHPVPSWTYLSQMHGPKVLTRPFTRVQTFKAVCTLENFLPQVSAVSLVMVMHVCN